MVLVSCYVCLFSRIFISMEVKKRMTTIIYHDNKLYADSRISIKYKSGKTLETSKTDIIYDGTVKLYKTDTFLYAGGGYTTAVLTLLAELTYCRGFKRCWTRILGGGDKAIQVTSDEIIEYISKESKVYKFICSIFRLPRRGYWVENKRYIKTPDLCVILGSGKDLAKEKLKDTKDMLKVFRFVAHFDEGTGGHLQVVEFPGTESNTKK